MWTFKFFLIFLFIVGYAFSESVAVFPVQGVNVDRSFADAFGMLLANKYSNVSNLEIINPPKAARAIGSDSDLVTAAKQLGVSEYLEIDAVGLYVSRKEVKEFFTDSSGGQRIIVQVNNKEDDDEDDDDDDDDDDDQRLLDNGKTVVTVTRRDLNGKTIHKAEMTLVTYGDIEESTDRISLALWKKISVEETRGLYNVTRREGMGHNKTFISSHKGFKFGMNYATSFVREFSPLVNIGFNYKAEGEKFFLEFGAGGKFPRDLFVTEVRQYGGVYFEIGGSYYILNKIIGVYLGGGFIPFIDFLNTMQMGLEPFVQIGVMAPRNSKMRFYSDIRIAQNVLAVMSGSNEYDSYYDDEILPSREKDWPTEFGIEFGLAF